MTCKKTIKKGQDYKRLIPFTSQHLFFTFNVIYLSPPSLGSQYELNGYTFTIIKVLPTQIVCISDSYDDLFRKSDTLRLLSGSGESALTYTKKTSTNNLDITGLTLKWRILKRLTDTPLAPDIVLDTKVFTTHFAPLEGKTYLTLSKIEVDALPVGIWYEILETTDATGVVSEIISYKVNKIYVDINQIT